MDCQRSVLCQKEIRETYSKILAGSNVFSEAVGFAMPLDFVFVGRMVGGDEGEGEGVGERRLMMSIIGKI